LNLWWSIFGGKVVSFQVEKRHDFTKDVYSDAFNGRKVLARGVKKCYRCGKIGDDPNYDALNDW